MAKRSDLAQKLLDDIRLRKEKLSMTQVTRQSAQTPSGYTYRNSQWSSRDSAEATTSKFSSKSKLNTEVTKMLLSTRHHKTPAQEGASQSIVPYGRARHTEHTIDLSMAIAIALSNSGKLQNIDLFKNATFGKEFILHHRPIDFREMDGRLMSDRLRPSTGRFPFLSNLQIGEISKGVQKLNKIIEVCSNGLNFDRDSIDIGRELLKGAMDLEEALRMIAILQEASDYMVNPKGKQVMLLKNKEEDESTIKVNQKKLLSTPRFSFDESPRHSHKNVRKVTSTSILEQNPVHLIYPEESKPSKSNTVKSSSNASMQFTSHRWSASCGPGSKPDGQFSGITSHVYHSGEFKSFSNGNGNSPAPKNTNKKQLSPKGAEGEKVRIPSVVAKLMGLEELPLPNTELKNSEVQKGPRSKQVKETGKILKLPLETSTKEEDAKIYSEKIMSPMDCQKKVPQGEAITATQATNSLEAVYGEGKTNVKDLINMTNIGLEPKKSPNPHFKINKQMNMTSMDQSKEPTAGKREVEGGIENTKTRDQKSKGKVEEMLSSTQKSLLKYDSKSTKSQPYAYHDDTVSKHDSGRRKKSQLLIEQRCATEELTIKQSKAANENASQQQTEVHRLKFINAVHETSTEIEHNAKNKLPFRKSDMIVKKSAKSSHEISTRKVLSRNLIVASKRSPTENVEAENKKECLKNSHQETVNIRNRSSTYHKLKTANGNLEEGRPLNTDPRAEKEELVAIKKPEHIPSAQKVNITQLTVHDSEKNRISEEELKGIGKPHATDQPPTQQTSVLHELHDGLKERISKDGGAIVSSHLLNLEKPLEQKTAHKSLLYGPLTDDCKRPKGTDQRIVAATASHDITIKASASQKSSELFLTEDQELKSFNFKVNQLKGPTDSRQCGNCNSLRWQNQAISEAEPALLTEKEHILKQILINSRHFLNTAQALFKLKIPLGVHQACENVCTTEDSKLVLDCGYEVMRRKGKREEVIFYMKMSFAPARFRCLDDLIIKLHDDLESLKFHSRTEGKDYDTKEYLHEMLERDVQNRNPDLNCMWDFGWNSMMFADTEKEEVITDVEKHVLNGLINELARDLRDTCITIS